MLSFEQIRVDCDDYDCEKIRNMLRIENILEKQHNHSMLKNKMRTSSFDSNDIDSTLTKESALVKGFDWDSYFIDELTQNCSRYL